MSYTTASRKQSLQEQQTAAIAPVPRLLISHQGLNANMLRLHGYNQTFLNNSTFFLGRLNIGNRGVEGAWRKSVVVKGFGISHDI